MLLFCYFGHKAILSNLAPYQVSNFTLALEGIEVLTTEPQERPYKAILCVMSLYIPAILYIRSILPEGSFFIPFYIVGHSVKSQDWKNNILDTENNETQLTVILDPNLLSSL